MNNRSKALLLLVAILIWASPNGVLADKRDSAPAAVSNKDSEIPTSDSSDSNQAESGEVKDKGIGKAESENGSNIIENSTPPVILIGAVRIIVQDVDNEPVERATVKVSPYKTGPATKKITNNKGIATFKNLPATNLVVQVTAHGHKSHRQTIDLENYDDEIAIVLKRRD